jgi:hypothetical protein
MRTTHICGSGSIVVAGFGGRTAICLRGTRRSLYRECSGLCRTGTRKRRAALCGTGCFIRRAGLRGAWTGVRSPRLRRTAARVCTGLWGPGACLRSFCILWVRRTDARRTASVCRAGARLPIRLCGRIRAEATCRHPLQRWRSLHRQSRLRSVGILQLRQRYGHSALLDRFGRQDSRGETRGWWSRRGDVRPAPASLRWLAARTSHRRSRSG